MTAILIMVITAVLIGCINVNVGKGKSSNDMNVDLNNAKKLNLSPKLKIDKAKP